MIKSRVLKSSLIIVRVLLILNILFGFMLLCGLIFWHMSPDSFNLAELVGGFKSGYGIADIKIHMKEPSNREGKIFLSELSFGMLHWLFLRGLIFTLLNIFGLLKLAGILQSIQSINTFYNTNVANLKAIGRYAALAAILSFFNFSLFHEEWDFHFSFPFGPVVISMIAFVLAEVFAEGKLLLEDKNMIV